jgi:hypothetical protein
LRFDPGGEGSRFLGRLIAFLSLIAFVSFVEFVDSCCVVSIAFFSDERDCEVLSEDAIFGSGCGGEFSVEEEPIVAEEDGDFLSGIASALLVLSFLNEGTEVDAFGFVS